MNKKLKTLADNLSDGGVITDYLDYDQISLLGLLSYEEILKAVGNHNDAQAIFWATAQFLAGNCDYYELQCYTDGVTPLDCAIDYDRITSKQEVLA
jgi:hypothetical protein